MKNLISIIINIYNGESFIDRCIDSLLHQTYSNIEIIIIDDGSTDKTGQIIDLYTDKRIRVFHTENKGISSSRRLGLSKVNGEYIIFIDCDDYVETTFLEKLYNTLTIQNADMAICEYYEEYQNYKRHIYIQEHLQIEDYTKDLIRGKTWSVVWNKLIETTIVRQNQITFPIGIRYWEDVPFSVCYSLYCNKIAYVHEPLYHYIKSNNESLTATEGTNLQFNQERVKILPIIEKHLKITHKYPQFETDIIWIKFWIKDAFITHRINKGRIQLWKETFPEVNKHYLEIYKNLDLLHYSLIHNINLLIYIYSYYYKIRHFIKNVLIDLFSNNLSNIQRNKTV